MPNLVVMLELGRTQPLRTGITLSGIFGLLTRSGPNKMRCQPRSCVKADRRNEQQQQVP